MAELGPLGDFAAVTEYPDAKTWQIEINDETIIFAELDEDGAMLALSCEIGKPSPSADAAKLHHLLLKYNGHGEETGGLVLALDSEDIVTQILRVPAAGLDRTALAGIVAEFLRKLEGWRTIVRDFRGGAASDGERPEDLTMSGFIRV
jgi:hypothetical protein